MGVCWVDHYKVGDLCVFPFMRSLSAGRDARTVQVLITFTPLVYREVLALSIHRHRPDFEVLLAPPGSSDGRTKRFRPHVLVQDAKEAVALLGLPDGVVCRIRMLTTERVDATVELDGLRGPRCPLRGSVRGAGEGRWVVERGRRSSKGWIAGHGTTKQANHPLHV